MAEPRVASLLASATEIVCALGCEEALVARSHECDYPPSVARLPAVTASKVRTETDSGHIDRQVKDIVAQGLSVYSVDADRLRALAPDVVVTQTQCEVCAVSPRDLEAALAAWTGAAPTIVSLAPDGLADVWADIRNVAAALGVPASGAGLVERLTGRMAAIARRAANAAARPRVACIEWVEPLMAAGNWMPELVAMAGGIDLLGVAGRHSPWLSWEALRAADPEVILVMPCGFDVARTRRDMPYLAGRPDWPQLQAVRSGRVYLADGNSYFNRPGPRLLDSLEILAEILHPDDFPPGHETTGWQRL